MHKKRIVIVGGGTAGTAAAASARRTDPSTEVIVLEREAVAGAVITQVPDALVERRGRAALRDVDGAGNGLLRAPPARFWEEQGIKLKTGHEVVAIHPERREVSVRAPSGALSAEAYDALVIAAGARPLVPDVPGATLPGVFALRRPTDAVPLDAHLAELGTRRAVVVGAGIPGMALAEALQRRGLDVTLVEARQRVLSSFLPALSARIETAIDEHGGRVLVGQPLERIERRGSALRVTTRGAVVEGDIVVLTCGALPDIGFARSAIADVGLSGAIRVDEMQHTGVADIYAAGECAETHHSLLRRSVFQPHPVAAYRQGIVAGANAAGGEKLYRGTVGTRSLRFFDVAIARTGLPAEDAQREGRDVFIATWRRPLEVSVPDVELMVLVVDKPTGVLLGAEMFGTEAVLLRIDVLAAAIAARLDLDAVAGLDLALAPPFSQAEDPIRLAAEHAFEELQHSLRRGEVLETGARPHRSKSFDADL